MLFLLDWFSLLFMGPKNIKNTQKTKTQTDWRQSKWFNYPAEHLPLAWCPFYNAEIVFGIGIKKKKNKIMHGRVKPKIIHIKRKGKKGKALEECKFLGNSCLAQNSLQS